MKLHHITICVALAVASGAQSQPNAAAQVNSLADRTVELQLNTVPYIAYFAGLPAPDHRRWPDRSPQGMEAFDRGVDALHEDLQRIDAGSLPGGQPRITYALLRESLESERQGRVCKSHLWNVSHMNGWHLGLPNIAREQPVGTPSERAQALERWGALPRLVDQEIDNLRRGLDAHYSAPKSVVVRVVKQAEGLAGGPPEKSPLASPAERSQDAAFKAAYLKVIAQRVNPALMRYAAYLRDDYMPRARESLAVSALPDGAACYQASLRSWTTLNRTAREVHDLGAATVARNGATVVEIGQKKFGTRDLGEIVKKVQDAPDNHFSSEQELVDYSRAVVARAKTKSAGLFAAMPEQEVRVEPFEAHMRGSGASSHYDAQVDPKKPAYYRISSEHWKTETRGSAEVVAVHEAYPGHHMQIAFARTLPQTPLAKLSFYSAYAEGWARYSEMLAEEAGIYETDYALLTRRTWPARGMVADPGLHVLGWTREQTIDYLAATRRFSRKEAEELVDRMAVMPGQLTAYDSGGLEILALREEAKRELGPRFDIKGFHKAVLELGAVPLQALRENVQAWIAAEKAKG